MPTRSRRRWSPRGPGEVKAKDIDLPAGVEILNPDAPIATLEKKTKLEMYLTIGRGRGYSPAEENKTEDQPIGVIPIDSIFSPIRRASYAVDTARVGQRTDFDKLVARGRDRRLDRARGRASRGGRDPDQEPGDLHRRRPGRGAHQPRRRRRAARRRSRRSAATDGDDRLIEELEIGVRAYNCLKRAGHPDGRRSRPALRVGAQRDPELRQALDRRGAGRLTALGLSLREE